MKLQQWFCREVFSHVKPRAAINFLSLHWLFLQRHSIYTLLMMDSQTMNKTFVVCYWSYLEWVHSYIPCFWKSIFNWSLTTDPFYLLSEFCRFISVWGIHCNWLRNKWGTLILRSMYSDFAERNLCLLSYESTSKWYLSKWAVLYISCSMKIVNIPKKRK